MNDNYTIFHLHTMLSNGVTNIDSITNYQEYIDQAKVWGMKAIAFSEHGSGDRFRYRKVCEPGKQYRFCHN